MRGTPPLAAAAATILVLSTRLISSSRIPESRGRVEAQGRPWQFFQEGCLGHVDVDYSLRGSSMEGQLDFTPMQSTSGQRPDGLVAGARRGAGKLQEAKVCRTQWVVPQMRCRECCGARKSPSG